MATDAKPLHVKPRLGRGLASLITNSAHHNGDADVGVSVATEASYKHDGSANKPSPLEVSVDDISPNPMQPRREFNEDELKDLAASIREQGILQPLVLAPSDGLASPDHPYVLVAGERRLRAARMAGLKNVPCVIRQATRQQMLEWALIENIQRADLNPVEKAQAYREYMDRFGLTQVDAAQQLGQPRATVANFLRILDLCDELRQMLRDGSLSFGHAKVLAGVTDQERQLSLARKVTASSLSVRQLETMVAEPPAAAGETAPERKLKPAYLRDLEERLTGCVGTKVSIMPGRAKHTGRIVVEFYNLDDFDRITGGLGLASGS
jgi:ParB family chromosome partitioning protein